MLRRVAFQKAVLAGVAGAATWEASVRLAIFAGAPVFDISRTIGVTAAGHLPAWQGWLIGISGHALVGVIWAIFYAYFFWTTYNVPPAIQGLTFSVGPAVLAGLFMVPQMGLMRPGPGASTYPGLFAVQMGWGGPVGLMLGHLMYGAVMGSIYRRPVGYRVGHEEDRVLRHLRRHQCAACPPHPAATDHDHGEFMFATGIECSAPTIENGRWRMDELDMTDHYRYWQTDLELVRELGLRYLRYGPPIHQIFHGPGKYDWTFMDAVAGKMQELGIFPIMDLCHFGLPRWLGNFQNEEFPQRFGEYAGAFAQRYPWVRLYTPVNEMYVTSKLSALDGWWNEQLRSETAFVTAIKHVVKGSVLAIQAILDHRPDAVIINSESSEFFQPCCPDREVNRIADFENQRRFIAMDLLYGVPVRGDVLQYLLDHGMPLEEYRWFMNQKLTRAVLGLDYYESNEKVINSDRQPQMLGELFGWYVITREYYERYKRPLMHTETNCPDAEAAPGWLWREWHNVQMMRNSGVPVVGFTWYSLQDQVDWNIGLGRPEGNVNPVGLFDLNRDPRPVAHAYRDLVRMFRNETIVPEKANVELEELVSTEAA